MKNVAFKINFFLILFVIHVSAHSRERKHQYPCGNKFYHYYLDNEPAEYGLYAGDCQKDKAAVYVGIVDALNFVVTGQIQLSPPGASYFANYSSFFTNESSKIWYLYKNYRHKYEWIDSKNGEEVPFAIDYGSDTVGAKAYIGRIKNSINEVILGVVLPNTGVMYYANNKGIGTSTQTGYQVLTCKSHKPDKKIPTPKQTISIITPPPESGCLNTWIEYKGDDAPLINGIDAGTYDCDNKAYVGKGEFGNYMIPGRIQTTPNAGLYYLAGGKESHIQNGSFYLANNNIYSYYWVNFESDFPENTVYARSNYLIPIARAKINGHMEIGYVLGYQAHFPSENSSPSRYFNYEILVCDPWPKYQCNQEWKKYDGNNTNDAFEIGIYKDDIVSFIGRGTCKQINGCDYELGRIQKNSSGVYYLDDLTASKKIDQTTAEYLVKNSNYVYKWVASRSGVKVENALELHKEGYRPFYFGITQINDNVFVGKVRPGEGLYFIDIDGKQKSTSSYNVLTCTSCEINNGVYKEEKDNNSWFGPFGCSIRKEWNFKLWRCVCRDDFKGIFTASNVKWNEDTCSYSI